MIIKNNEFTKLNTSYFKSFTPFSIDNGLEATDQIASMVSYNIVPTLNGVVVDQSIAANDSYEFILSVKNLTTNVLLDIELESEDYFIITPKQFVLSPEQVQNVNVSINNRFVDEANRGLQFLTQITLIVKNIKNGSFAQRRIGVTQLPQERLPDVIEIN